MNKIFHGDCLEVMQGFDANSIDSIVTDPPYGLSFMGKDWDHGVPGVPFWAEMLRVTKPGAFLLAFGGTRTYHRLACAIEDAGWEIRDCIMWVYGSGFPKSHDVSKAIDKAAGAEREIIGTKKTHLLAGGGSNGYGGAGWSTTRGDERGSGEVDITAPATDAAKQFHGYGTALKPAYEPILVAMKPCDGTFANNALTHGVAGMNVDGCRVPLNGDYKCGANGRPSQTGLGDNYDSSKANQHSEVGRFPANLIHDGSEEVVELFPQTAPSREGKPRAGKNGDGWGMTATGAEYNDRGSAARFFYCAKASTKERNGSKHPTVKPLELMRYLVRLTRPPHGGIVLDPFAGSGTTAEASILEDRQFIAIEQNAEHIPDIEGRIKRAKTEMQGTFDFG